MEGVFAHSSHVDDDRESVANLSRGVRNQIEKLRVCSLSATFDSHLLWSHYADGFNGVAICFDLPDDDLDIRTVDYRGVFGGYHYEKEADPRTIAKQILHSKYQEWSYEREIRILSASEWYKLKTPVDHIIVGHRVHPALFDTLQIIGERQNVRFCKVGIGDEGLDADFVPSYADREKGRA